MNRFAPALVALIAIAGFVLLVDIDHAHAQSATVSRNANASSPPAPAMSSGLPEIRIANATFGDAIEFLRDASGANIHVNWGALEQLNITRELPVNMHLRSVTLRTVLKLLLADVGGGLVTYYIDDGIIEITTKELADQQLITQVYPVEDLIMEIPNFTDAPDFQIQSSQGGRGSGGGNSILTGSFGEEERETRTDQERGEELVQLIMDTVDPEVWRENGGTASIRFFRGKLIVTAPRSTLEAIGGPVR